MQSTIDKILDLNIVDVISKYLELKKKGANHTACCPFHGEKTPSFSVSPSRNIYKCFGCGKGGGAINFVMDHENLNFVEAVKLISKDHNIDFEIKEKTTEEVKVDRHKDSLYIVNKFAASFFCDQLKDPKNKKALEYVKERWNDESIAMFDIGFAPDGWSNLIDFAKTKGVKKELLIDAGLIKESDNKKGYFFDVFRNRVIIPITDKMGRIIGFTGRIDEKFTGVKTDKKIPKYLNTPETPIYNKSTSLYGINLAASEIRKENVVYLVEGNPDVIRLHEIGVFNTVGTCGTSLTPDHIKEIKRLCNSVTIIGDNDTAGLIAIESMGKKLIKDGLFCNVMVLPDGEEGEKEDPDSFFNGKTKKFFNSHASDYTHDYLRYIANKRKDAAKNPEKKQRLVNDLCSLIICFPEDIHDFYIEEIVEVLGNKKVITDRIKKLKSEKEAPEKKSYIPEHVKASDFDELGFYEDNNCYQFRGKEGKPRQGSNFVLEPLFHIPGTESKRLFRITNVYKFTKYVEMDQSDLISLGKFKLRVESLGNFVWEVGDVELTKLKKFIYKNTLTCDIIKQMGWQPSGFFVWANGCFNGEYKKADNLGIVEPFKDTHYYIPSASQIYEEETGLYEAEKKFSYRTGTVTLKDFTSRLVNVFGDNAKISFCYLLASLFRDVIVSEFRFFPILNLFGLKGSGKTELGESLLHFFGPDQKGINLPNSTEPAIADYISQSRNSLSLLDEYKNNFEPSKIEFLKGLWKAIGRTRINMDKDKKKETTAVDNGIILCGQEMPTADIALFSRLIYLTYYKTEFTSDEKKEFQALKAIEKRGLGHLTHEILLHREYFANNYSKYYDIASNDLREALGDEMIEDRIYNNWLVAIAAFLCLKDKIDLSFTYNDVVSITKEQILKQNKETKKSNEISNFWKIVDYLAADGLIQIDVDFKVKVLGMIKTDIAERTFEREENVLIIQHSRVIPLYRKHGKQIAESILPMDSIDYYLKNDKAYLGKKASEKFVKVDKKTGFPLLDDNQKPIQKVTTAYCFLYDDLNLNLMDFYEEDNKPF